MNVSPRPSKRDKGRLAAEIEGPEVSRPESADDGVEYRSDVVNATDVNRHSSQKVSPRDPVQPSILDFDPSLLPQPEWTTIQPPQGPATNGSHESHPSNGHSVLDAWSGDWVSPSSELPHRSPNDIGIRPPGRPYITSTAIGIDYPISSAAQPSELNPSTLNVVQADLRQSFTETYFEYCYTWCPVLTRETLAKELEESPLLDNALAIVGSNVRPPLVPHAGPAAYYNRARRLFYEEEEENLIVALEAISLFYWWAPRPPSVLHKHSSWWWTSVVIKHAQQAGFYRESAGTLARQDIEPYIRRRIWWTAFVSPLCGHISISHVNETRQARERLTAICQGKPCLIDPDDCNIPPPSLQDFPDLEDKTKAEVFVYWVRLCAIIGRISKRLSRSTNPSSTTNAFPGDLSKELVDWVQSLPPHLQLPIGSSHTPNFNRDVHQLHLPYLAVIVVLHLTRTSQSPPQALPPATLAGSCIARILKDVLIRSGTRFLMPITCWYVGMGFIALLQASRSEYLQDGATADLEILTLAIKELKNMWATAAVFEQTFERLRSNGRTLSSEDFPNRHLGNEQSARALNSEAEVLHSGIGLLDYFPFVTSQTSVVADKLLAQQNMDLNYWDGLAGLAFDMIPNYQDLMEGLDTWADQNAFP